MLAPTPPLGALGGSGGLNIPIERGPGHQAPMQELPRMHELAIPKPPVPPFDHTLPQVMSDPVCALDGKTAWSKCPLPAAGSRPHTLTHKPALYSVLASGQSAAATGAEETQRPRHSGLGPQARSD